MSRSLGLVCVSLAIASVLAGCGQKGPLYLPESNGKVVTRPGGSAPAPAPQGTQQPAAQSKKDSDDDSSKK